MSGGVRAAFAVCISSSGASGAAGGNRPPPTFPLAVSLDAVTKLGHYTNCGSASSSLRPQLDTFFGGASAQVESQHAAGRLDLKSTMADPS